MSQYNNGDNIQLSINGSQSDINSFINDFPDNVTIEKANGVSMVGVNATIPYTIIILVLILALLFDEKNKMKEYNILLLTGYSKLKILLFELKNILKYLFFLTIVAIVFIFLAKGFEISLLPYFILYSFKYLILTLVIIIYLLPMLLFTSLLHLY